MGRPKRITLANRCAHCFIHAMPGIRLTKIDKETFLEVLRSLCDRHGYRIIYFSLMDTHCHWLMEFSEEKSCGDILGNIHTCLSKAYNKLHNRRGHLWRERYKDVTIEEDFHLWTAIIYVALNRIKSGAIASLEEDLFSSYRTYVHGHQDGITTMPSLYETLGRTQEERQSEFKTMLKASYQAWREAKNWERIEKGEDVLVGNGRVSLKHLALMFDREEKLLRKMEEKDQRKKAKEALVEGVKEAKDKAMLELMAAAKRLSERLVSKGIPRAVLRRFWANEDFIAEFVSKHTRYFKPPCTPVADSC